MEQNSIPGFDIARLIPETVIGSGAFGKVYGVKLYDGTKVAVKEFMDPDDPSRGIASFVKEVNFLKSVNHPNIIRILGSCEHGKRLLIIMDLAEGGSLYKYLHESQQTARSVYSWETALTWLTETAVGVSYLHGEKIIHRDLKTQNILLTGDHRHCKICDFGIASEPKTTLTSGVGTAPYMAPEVIRTNGYTYKCDVYSFGVVTWEVLACRKPYTTIAPNGRFERMYNTIALIFAVANGLRPDPLPNCPLSNLITRCLKEKTDERSAMVEILRDLTVIQATLKPGSPEVPPLPLTIRLPIQPPAEAAAIAVEPTEPVSSPPEVTRRSLPLVHTVVSGDTAYGIARKYFMTYPQLCHLNPTKGKMDLIHVGDKIVIASADTVAKLAGFPDLGPRATARVLATDKQRENSTRPAAAAAFEHIKTLPGSRSKK